MAVRLYQPDYSGDGVFFAEETYSPAEKFLVHPPEYDFVKLPVWLNRGTVAKLASVFDIWWATVKEWLELPLRSLNVDTCPLGVLDLIASQRNIERFNGEPESLYRLRVKYAYVNAVDAGSVAGIKRIFERLGVGYVEVRERVPGNDWDVISFELPDSALGNNTELLNLIVRKYGRTCRRYEFTSTATIKLGVAVREFGHTWDVDRAD